ncbi:hypothetical protein GALL_545410 [mine drainage metagenome]|uniref:Uncharacterized protein n=1 Tax=mine drainage metagenome TaxID=410659 RepID=A0A1J5P042_9ZZZZ
MQTDAGIEPGVADHLAGAERNVGELGHPSVAVRAVVGEVGCGVQAGVTGAPDIEILPGEDDPVVGAVGKRALQLQAVELVVRIGAGVHKARVQILKLANEAAAKGQPVIVALILVLGIEADVSESIGQGKRPACSQRKGWIDPWMHVHRHPERADHERIPAPVRLQRDAPIGRNAAEQTGPVERVHAERVLRIESEGLVAGQFQIEQVIDERVGADTADARGECALDRRAGGGRAGERRYGVGIGPGRRGVPHILNGRVVVGRDAIDQIKRADARGVGIADVGIVPGPGMLELVRRRAGQRRQGIRRAVGDLREGADIIGDRSAPESAER